MSEIAKCCFFVVAVVFNFFDLCSWFSSTSIHVLKCQKYNSTVSETDVYKTNAEVHQDLFSYLSVVTVVLYTDVYL